jgi:hypothetical protein
LQNDRNTKN